MRFYDIEKELRGGLVYGYICFFYSWSFIILYIIEHTHSMYTILAVSYYTQMFLKTSADWDNFQRKILLLFSSDIFQKIVKVIKCLKHFEHKSINNCYLL